MKGFEAILIICMSIILQVQSLAQNNQGIRWMQGLNWKAIKSKAQSENKYIFVDCFATWCIPCKRMDSIVYKSPDVVNLLNESFVCVKVQMDSLNNRQSLQSSVVDAREMQMEHRISVFPTYLFFLPNGEAIHKQSGYKSVEAFIATVNDAKNPETQYYTLIHAYEKGAMSYKAIPNLLKLAKQNGDLEIALRLSNDYYNYLRGLEKEKLFNRENLEFIATNINSSSQNLFSLFYSDGNRVDEVMTKKGYAMKVVNHVIWLEEVLPFLKSSEVGQEPNWHLLHGKIKDKFGKEYAYRNELRARLRWYEFYKKDSAYLSCFIKQIEKYGTDTSDIDDDHRLNNVAYELIFKNSRDPNQIKKATKWMEEVVKRNSFRSSEISQFYHAFIDTYANLLYKSGRVEEALFWEEKALVFAKKVNDLSSVKEFEEVISKMKNGTPTWSK